MSAPFWRFPVYCSTGSRETPDFRPSGGISSEKWLLFHPLTEPEGPVGPVRLQADRSAGSGREPLMPRIFVNDRNNDEEATATLIDLHLSERFGSEAVSPAVRRM